MSQEDRSQIIRRLLTDVLDGHHTEIAGELFAPDVVDHNKVVLTEPEGPGAAEEGLRMFLTAFADLHVRLHQIIAEKDIVVAHFELAGTNTGPYRYLPQPTGRHARWEAVGIFRVTDGRISEIWGIGDRLTMLTQLGLIPDIG